MLTHSYQLQNAIDFDEVILTSVLPVTIRRF